MGILRYTIRRLLQAIPVLLGIVTITFLLTNAIPGDPVQIMLGPSPSAQMVDKIRAQYGLNQPLPVRYVHYLASVAQGSLGQSIYYRTPVTTKIMQRLPVTLLLMLSVLRSRWWPFRRHHLGDTAQQTDRPHHAYHCTHRRQ